MMTVMFVLMLVLMLVLMFLLTDKWTGLQSPVQCQPRNDALSRLCRASHLSLVADEICAAGERWCSGNIAQSKRSPKTIRLVITLQTR